jgi:hypothetical protein
MRVLPYILMIFAFPLLAALLYSYFKESAKRKEKVRREWADRLDKFERDLGRRLTHEEVKIWLLKEWFRAAWGDVDGFARSIEKRFLPGP